MLSGGESVPLVPLRFRLGSTIKHIYINTYKQSGTEWNRKKPKEKLKNYLYKKHGSLVPLVPLINDALTKKQYRSIGK